MSPTPIPPSPERRAQQAAPPDSGAHTGSHTRPEDLMSEPESALDGFDDPPPELQYEQGRRHHRERTSRLATAALGIAVLAILAALGYLAVVWP